MKEFSAAVAYPGLPVVFAEGFRLLDGRRISLHSHASFALTSLDGGVRTQTTVRMVESGVEFTVNGKPVEGSRGAGMRAIVDGMLSKAGVNSGVRVESANYGIATGSSDSGAAALVVALNDLLELGLNENELCCIGGLGSETAYRSILGGLCECKVEEGDVTFSKIKGAGELSEIRAYSVPFNLPRHSADELHAKVVGHPAYALRASVTEGRIKMVRDYAARKNLVGVLEVMESDARDVQRMFEEGGVTVIKPPMRKLCSAVESIRKRGIKCYWNVAGGSHVYVFAVSRYAEAVEEELENLGYSYTKLKVAGPARVWSNLVGRQMTS